MQVRDYAPNALLWFVYAVSRQPEALAVKTDLTPKRAVYRLKFKRQSRLSPNARLLNHPHGHGHRKRDERRSSITERKSARLSVRVWARERKGKHARHLSLNLRRKVRPALSYGHWIQECIEGAHHGNCGESQCTWACVGHRDHKVQHRVVILPSRQSAGVFTR